MNLLYKLGGLFDAPKETILVHACNTYGVWGSGIARVFKEKYPASFKEYHTFCKTQPGRVAGMSYLTNEGVGCLMTSTGYADTLDEEAAILGNTLMALEDLFRAYIPEDRPVEIASNRFNAGLFNVPWERTEKILKAELLSHPNVTWTVYIPEEDIYAKLMARQG
jgi:ADP-ribose 1''-phosphate phosphatase